MRIERAEIYPVWDLTPPAIPARSRLYPLEPVGLGTAEVESLSSYVTRLAEAHCLPIAALFNGVASPLVLQARGLTTTSDSQALVFFNAARPINGMGVTASACVQALKALTLRHDLRWLTALAWQEFFPRNTGCAQCARGVRPVLNCNAVKLGSSPSSCVGH